MVGLIFVHECGHAVAMRHYNVPFSPMVFVPFMGAVIAMKDHPRNAYQDGVIGLAGPVAGTAAALTLGVSGAALDSQLMIALADWGFIINLFNLMPVGSMDGGRVLSAVSPYFGVAGLVGGAGCIYYDLIGNPLFYLIMLGGTYSSVQRVMGW
jgi:Zn-dependent protease